MKIKINEISPAYRHVIIDNPPINIFDQEMSEQFQALLTKLETDDTVKVVVFESANPDYFMATSSLLESAEFHEEQNPSGVSSLSYLLRRMARVPFLTVGLLRGRAHGAGSEFLLGLDIRFASREKALLSQIDLGTELVNDADGFERLCRMIGRPRALEIILGGEDLDADTAERLALINRSIPDEKLDEFVERFVSHISSFDRDHIAFVKTTRLDQTNPTIIGDSDKMQINYLATSKWLERQEQIVYPVDRYNYEGREWDLVLGEQLRPDYGS